MVTLLYISIIFLGMDYAHTKKLHDQIEESVGENNERWEIKLDKDVKNKSIKLTYF